MTSLSTNLNAHLRELRRVGREAPRDLLDGILAHGDAAIAPLMLLATDPFLHSPDATEPDVWAPVHAIGLLGELHAAEAVPTLIPLLRLDDDWLNEYLPQALGKIGSPAVEPLRAALWDATLDTWGATAAAHALNEAVKHHPELRDEVVQILTARLDDESDDRDDAEGLNGFIISYLSDLEAVESVESIRRAFKSSRVDEFVIRPEHVGAALGTPIGLSVTQAVDDVTGTGQRRSSMPPELELLANPPDLLPAGGARRPYTGPKVGRNEPCPCGSGAKYKKCCGR